MKPKTTAREVALEVLTKVEKDKSYSNLQLNQTLKKTDLSRPDINFATEMIYGTIQHLNKIDWILNQFIKKNTKLEIWVKSLLRLSIYQMMFLDRVPSHAVVNEAVNIAKKKGHKGISGLINGVLRNLLRNKDSMTIPENLPIAGKISLEHSHPEWMVNRFIQEYGVEEAEEICRVNNLAPYHSIRVNLLKITREEMLENLKKELNDEAEVVPSPLSAEGIRIKGGGNLAFSDWYKKGYISIQDESSMLVAGVLDPKPNMVVLDAMAAPGGKTTHIAEKMGDQGKIIASDLHKHKIKLIDEQQKRLGLHIIQTLHSDARNIRNDYGQVFDRILLDVPCSGLGVIRRKPDLKWTKVEADIKQLESIQNEILESISPLLKEGGVLVYSTCTMTSEENQRMITQFVKRHPEFQLDPNMPQYLPNEVNKKLEASNGMIQILPHYFHTDGFFISRLVKSGENF